MKNIGKVHIRGDFDFGGSCGVRGWGVGRKSGGYVFWFPICHCLTDSSQAAFPGSDPREFWQRAKDRNVQTAREGGGGKHTTINYGWSMQLIMIEVAWEKPQASQSCERGCYNIMWYTSMIARAIALNCLHWDTTFFISHFDTALY